MLDDAQRQGMAARNVAHSVNRVAQTHKDLDTYTESEVQALLAWIETD
ncbi:hypothetical protein ABQF17_12840 [Mycolicibacterium elephantis]|nr:hypothetical protein [Mycolicibacterium elephantis]